MNERHDDSFAAEYDALAGAGGYHELADWSVVALSGADRQAFLHNMCTNDIRKRGAGDGCEAFLTDVKGKIVAHAFVLLRDDRILLVTVPGQAERIIGHLDRYIIREDVQLADVSAAQAWFVAVGAQVESLLPGGLDAPWRNGVGNVGAVEALAARFPLAGRHAYLVAVERDGVAALRGELRGRGVVECGEAAWTSVRVEAGLPLFGVDFDHANLPQEVARDAQAISFIKGCYLGQETIARLDALGHVNKQLVTLKFSADAAPGTSLMHDGQPAGAARSVGWSRRLDAPLALAMIRRGTNAIGTRLDFAGGSAEVVATPAVADG